MGVLKELKELVKEMGGNASQAQTIGQAVDKIPAAGGGSDPYAAYDVVIRYDPVSFTPELLKGTYSTIISKLDNHELISAIAFTIIDGRDQEDGVKIRYGSFDGIEYYDDEYGEKGRLIGFNVWHHEGASVVYTLSPDGTIDYTLSP